MSTDTKPPEVELVERFLAELAIASSVDVATESEIDLVASLERMFVWVRARLDEGSARALFPSVRGGAGIVDLRKALGWRFGERGAELRRLAERARS